MRRYFCPRCDNKVLYNVRRGKKRCKKCLYEWKQKIAGFSLTRKEWQKILFWFVLDHDIRTVVEQTKISKYSVEKTLKITRQIMARDVPGIFEGTVEVDETYLGGQKKNKIKNSY